MHYVHKMARCGPEIATFRTKTLHFFRAIRLNWLAIIELRGARGRNFFFYHGFADLLRHILCPNLQFRTPLSILT